MLSHNKPHIYEEASGQKLGPHRPQQVDLWTADSSVYIIFRHSIGTAWDSVIPFRGSLPKNRRSRKLEFELISAPTDWNKIYDREL